MGMTNDAGKRIATAGSPRPSPFRQLVAADTKDLSRTLQAGFATLFLFGFFLLVIWALSLMLAGSGSPRVVVDGSDAGLAGRIDSALSERGIDLVDDPSAANILVQEAEGKVTMVVSADETPAWQGVWQAVRGAGVEIMDITVVDSEGVWKADILQANLAPALGLGLMAIAFVGTAVPLVSMRERGTLRLLGTTPLRNDTLVLSLIPARLCFALVEFGVVLVIAATRHYVEPGMLWRLSISMLLSLVMLFPLAFLLGSRARNAANMQQLAVTLTMLLVGLGGGILPSEIIPGPLQVLFNVIPTTWMIQALGADLAGIEPDLPLSALWVLMAVCGAVAFVLAARLFSWDREPVRRGTIGTKR
ncbi:hypothetical protein CJ226_07205 [Microbacterium sp. UMB0228]|nr:hypothetical protein CJ226_07205 [Microbacterium sp. UMB0228]